MKNKLTITSHPTLEKLLSVPKDKVIIDEDLYLFIEALWDCGIIDIDDWNVYQDIKNQDNIIIENKKKDSKSIKEKIKKYFKRTYLI